MTEVRDVHATDRGARVVAGLDGTDRDASVLGFAAAEAELRAGGLHLVHAREAVSTVGITAETVSLLPATVDDSEGILADAEQRVRAERRSVPVSSYRPVGSAAAALVEASTDADLVVVGSGRRSALETLVLGSVTYAVAARRAHPVAVVGPEPAPEAPYGRVIVAVDGAPPSRGGPGAAGGCARGASLTLLTAWHLAVVEGYVVTEPDSPGGGRSRSDTGTSWRSPGRGPQGRDRGGPGRAATRPRRRPRLLRRAVGSDRCHGRAASAEADLLVVGSRGHGGFVGQLLGSISHGVLKRAQCPVLVVRSP
ncbi:MAG: universal stress protein [Nocardioides sp.]